MKPIIGSILVRVDLAQKQQAKMGDSFLKTGKNYNDNFRERNPVVAYVEQGCKEIPTGCHIVCNYSHFDLESPLQLSDELYAIPIDSEIYAIVNFDGSLTPIMGNALVKRITIETAIELPEELKKPYLNRGILLTDTEQVPKGKFIYWLPMSDYEICYTWEGVEKRALKIHQSEITGYLK